jgi:nitrogen PTS system EIIA component
MSTFCVQFRRPPVRMSPLAGGGANHSPGRLRSVRKSLLREPGFVELKPRDVARLLNVSEETIDRWAREGILPAHRVHDHYQFNRVELQEWAASHGHRVSPDLFAPNGSAVELPSLAAAIVRGGVHHGVQGRTREQVLEAVSNLPRIPAGVDRGLLYQLLVGREALASTGVGSGIAIPHPRDPVVVQVDEPCVFLCLLAQPVDFGALDGQPVHTLFTLLSPTIHSHLQILSRLSFVLHDATLVGMLRSQAPEAAILDRLGLLEAPAAERHPVAGTPKRADPE